MAKATCTSSAKSSVHTPGPWRLDHSGCEIVAPTVSVAITLHENRRIPDAERKANGRLIAAAPRLLAELKEAVDIFRSLERSDGVNGGDLVDCLEDWINRRALPAIAEAETNTL